MRSAGNKRKAALRAAKRLIFPPVWVYFVIVPASFALLAVVFAKGSDDSPAAYAAYVLSAYSLTVVITAVVRLARRVRADREEFVASLRLVRLARSTKLGTQIIESPETRRSLGLLSGTAVDLGYTVFRGVTGIIYGSAWFISLAVYHLVLGALRCALIVSGRHVKELDGGGRLRREYRAYTVCAALLLLSVIPMLGMTILMVRADSGFRYPGYVIYLSAMYAFYKIISATISVFRTRRLGSPIRTSGAVLNFTAALMSVLGLQTAMIAEFSTGSDNFRVIMNAVTGGVVLACVTCTAVYMLIHSAKMKKKLR